MNGMDTSRVDLTQEEIAGLLGVSQQAISSYMARGILRSGTDLETMIRAYVAHLRAVIDERERDEPLIEQRTRLAAEQADRIAMQNADMRSALMPRTLLEAVLTLATAKIAETMDDFRLRLHRSERLPPGALDFIDSEMRRVQAALRSLRLEDAEAEVDGLDA